MTKIVKLPVPVASKKTADEHTRSDTERKQRLFAWAAAVLKQLGLERAMDSAMSIVEMYGITFDAESMEVILAIRDALHPVNGRREEHFRGLSERGLKQILKNRFAELKKERAATLRQRGGKQKQPLWEDQLILDKHGNIVANLANLILILRESPKWKGVLGYDTFHMRVVIRKPPPWSWEAADSSWTDHHESRTRVWFQREAGVSPTLGDVGRAVQAAGQDSSFHPVRDYFNSLAWDSTPRLESWLQTYLHVEDGEYVRAIGPRYLISAVARIYEPGCKVDHTLVLEGSQGRLKSTALRILAVNDEWFTDRLSHVANKDAMLETAGVLIMEIAEMDALTKATNSAIKRFFTATEDRFRPPYGKHMTKRPRQLVFAITINSTAGGYLKDPTGARRFWPVACQGMIDLKGLEQVRDQLWAEAVQQYRAGAKWWLETPELEALATAEQAALALIQAPDNESALLLLEQLLERHSRA
jgi:predicted P-loop ATPase